MSKTFVYTDGRTFIEVLNPDGSHQGWLDPENGCLITPWTEEQSAELLAATLRKKEPK